MPFCACLMAAKDASSSGTTSDDLGYTGNPGPTSVSFSRRKLPPGVRTVSLALAAESPIERTTRLARNNPPANKVASPVNKPIIIHMSDLDEDELPDTDPSAIDSFSQAGTIRPTLSLSDGPQVPA